MTSTLKHKSTQQYCYLNTVWNVYDCAGGLNDTYLDKIFATLHALSEQTIKLFVLRFDLHLPKYTELNTHISDLRDRLYEHIEQNIKSRERNYVVAQKRKALIWAREQISSKAQHYHCALILDGNLFNNPTNILGWIKTIWSKSTNGNVPKIPHPYYNLNTRDMMQRQRVIFRLSYLAKNAGKNTVKGVRYFGSSQHKPSTASTWNPEHCMTSLTDLGNEWLSSKLELTCNVAEPTSVLNKLTLVRTTGICNSLSCAVLINKPHEPIKKWLFPSVARAP
ncbi:YagK/YfjJ domain-containing protein [Vibrio ulleungensis]|uniref:Inovirus-type Gp2 protein n=1 Tax=Vibrio ulleungensis TaxID=2807619 RepID=A0ABS2HPS8_9VIBR|nr:inovirus-type Gp2 protein [Vibrio ulleungensis]MBM7038213.1 inovirus-type Gp2 protein [Vibrio ulleungensis]